MKTQSYLGKYREIILAVAFFLIFDMAVLVLNFYISFQLSDSAINLNLSGRQRMLSQRMTKSLMIKQIDAEQAVANPKNDEELAKTVALFDSTLAGFEQGGMVMGTDGKKVQLKALHAPKYTDILHQARQIWQPYQGLLKPVLSGAASREEIEAVVGYARKNNVELLTLMNQLTTELEKDASQRADFLRYVQTAGMLLATLNFLFILFKFIRRLRENDRLVEAAQQETAEILGTVKEGLFLLDADYRIGSQFSASLSTILGTPITAGMDFREELRKRLSSDRFEAASDYISLLLAGRVNEALVEDLNPLIAIPLQFASAGGQARTRYLTFEFNRVVIDGVISHLLVSVFDVTEQQALEIALAEAKKQAKTEVEVMLEILRVNPALLAEFLTGTERVLQAINNELKAKHGGRDAKKLVHLVFRHIHTIKGEAAALGLELFESLAQEFEKTLAALRDKERIGDDDLLALPGPLDEFFQKVATIQELSKKLENFSSSKAALPSVAVEHPPIDSFVGNLNQLAQRIARDHEKSVNLTAELERLETLPAQVQKEVKDITLQLLRNAVAHGVEPMHVRKLRNKAPVGSIYVGLGKDGENYELVVRDDGHGLVAEDIKQALIEKGLYTQAQLEELDPKQIIMKIFEPGFSTTVEADRDSGQGVGMDIVKQKIGALGARLGIASQKNLYTMFSIRFQA